MCTRRSEIRPMGGLGAGEIVQSWGGVGVSMVFPGRLAFPYHFWGGRHFHPISTFWGWEGKEGGNELFPGGG